MTILATNNLNPVLKSAYSSNTQRLAPLPTPAPQATAAAPAAPAQTASLELQQVQQAIERLKQSIKPSLANSLEFQVDQSTGKTLVKILDAETKTVVRQIPSEELLIIARALDNMQGRGGLVERQA